MTRTRNNSLLELLQRFATAIVALALLGWLSAPAAQATPGGGGDDKGGRNLTGEDGVGTLPFTFTPPTGVVLTGTLGDLLQTVVSVNVAPEGVLQLSDGRWAVLFGHGSLVDLDRQALATLDVRAYFSAGAAFDGGHAVVSSTAGPLASFELEADLLIEVPLGQLYAPTSQVPGLTIDANGAESLLHRTILAPQGDVLRIGQMTVGG